MKPKERDKLSLENLTSSLKSHEIELDVEEPIHRSKSIASTSKLKSAKDPKSEKTKEETLDEGFDNSSDVDELAYITKSFHLFARKRRFSSRTKGNRNYGLKNKSEYHES